jgi:hypothetical protein
MEKNNRCRAGREDSGEGADLERERGQWRRCRSREREREDSGEGADQERERAVEKVQI